MTKEFFWSGTSGDKITVTYSGTPADESEMTIESDPNTTSSDRTKTLNVHVESDTSIGVPLNINLNKPVECNIILYGLDIPVSCTYSGYTVTNKGTSVSMDIPIGSPQGTTERVTKLTMVANNNRWCISASTYAATYYIVIAGASGNFMVSDINAATTITDFTCPWNVGDRIYNRRKSSTISDGTYLLNTSYTQLVFESAPTTNNLYRDLSTNKLYKYDGTTLVEMTN